MGYGPKARSSSFFFCTFMDRTGVVVHKLAERRMRKTFSHLDRISLGDKRFFLTGFLSGHSG